MFLLSLLLTPVVLICSSPSLSEDHHHYLAKPIITIVENTNPLQHFIPHSNPSRQVGGNHITFIARISNLQKNEMLLMFSAASLRFSSLFSTLKLRTTAKAFSSSSSSTEYRPWSGLQSWRDGSVNENRWWGRNGPEPLPPPPPPPEVDVDGPTASVSSLAELGTLVLSTSDPITKAKLTHLAYSRWRHENLPLGVSTPPDRPARPPKPQLVTPKEIPAPKNSGLPLNAYMLHNLAHVELNAIDLAWDTVVRFSQYSEVLGEGFFADFAHVADDESRHFSWCSQRLAELGFSYGDMPAHSFLWRECEKTSGNVAARLAAIPLVQEARGLDAGPRLVQKLIGFGDCRTSKIVARIAEEEVAHVAVGVSWFLSVCDKMGRAPCTSFKDLLNEYNVELRGPFNYSARDVAGIPRDWYDSSSMDKPDKNEKLSEVHDRLACIISMEKENSSLNTQPQ